MAAVFAASHTEDIDGLFLLAAYSTEDISESGLAVSAMYGSEDKVMSKLSFDKYLQNLPGNVRLYVIDGGNHAQFGSYGEQEGDGDSTISREQQQLAAAQHILYMIQE